MTLPALSISEGPTGDRSPRTKSDHDLLTTADTFTHRLPCPAPHCPDEDRALPAPVRLPFYLARTDAPERKLRWRGVPTPTVDVWVGQMHVTTPGLVDDLRTELARYRINVGHAEVDECVGLGVATLSLTGTRQERFHYVQRIQKPGETDRSGSFPSLTKPRRSKARRRPEPHRPPGNNRDRLVPNRRTEMPGSTLRVERHQDLVRRARVPTPGLSQPFAHQFPHLALIPAVEG